MPPRGGGRRIVAGQGTGRTGRPFVQKRTVRRAGMLAGGVAGGAGAGLATARFAPRRGVLKKKGVRIAAAVGAGVLGAALGGGIGSLAGRGIAAVVGQVAPGLVGEAAPTAPVGMPAAEARARGLRPRRRVKYARIGKNMPSHRMLTRLRRNLRRHAADARTILMLTSPASLRRAGVRRGYRGYARPRRRARR